jgi:lipid-A-disaccharide synthase
MNIAIVAGEISGDMIGAGLMKTLLRHYPDAIFQGVGGERMLAQGLNSLLPLEKLSVMGLVEVIRHLPELISIQKKLYRHFTTRRPDVFIGIDAPDFNLRLERRLRERGIPTVHYVSPTVWAWRRRRLHQIAHAVDLMLTLFPFEARFYQERHIPVRYVEHPLADEIPLQDQRSHARRILHLESHSGWPLLALLPGSRLIEVKVLTPLFVKTARRLQRKYPSLQVLIPAPTARIQDYLTHTLADLDFSARIIAGQSREVIAAADVVLLASGTATLEALLLGRPMVVAYKVAPVTAWLARKLVQLPHFALPNLLAGKSLIPEFCQEQATVDALEQALLGLLSDMVYRNRLLDEFRIIHQQLRQDASTRAAAAIAELLNNKISSTT